MYITNSTTLIANKVSQKLENVKEISPLTDGETERAIRDAIIAEEDAIKQYETVADSTNNEKVKKVLQDIANEEKVHVGELQELLESLDKEEKDLIEEGRKEVQEM